MATESYTFFNRVLGKTLARRLAFRDPRSEAVEPLGEPFIYAMLCGPLYFMARGIWVPGLLHLAAVPLTLGLAWLVVPFLAEGIVRGHFRRKGWVEFRV